MDIIHRLNALANYEHDDLEIGYEAAETILALRVELEEMTAERDALRVALQKFGRHTTSETDCPVCDVLERVASAPAKAAAGIDDDIPF